MHSSSLQQNFFNRTKKIQYKKYKISSKIKEMINNLPYLSLPLDSDYLVIKCDGCERGWGVDLKKKKNKYEKN